MPRYKLRENYPRLVSMENKTYVSLLESGVPGDMLTLVENAFRIIFEDAAPAPAVDTFYTDMADALGIDLSAARMDDGSLNKKKVKSLIGQDERYQNAMMAAADVMNAAEAKSGLKDEKGYLYGDMQQSKGYLGFIAKFKQALALSFVRDGVPAPGVKDLISRRIADGLQSRLKSDQGISTPETRSHTYDLMSAGTFKPSSIGWNLIDSDIFASYPYGKNDSILVRKLAGADAIRSLILEMRVTDAIMKMDALRNDDGVEGYSFYKKRDDEEKLLVLVRGGTVLGTASSDSDFYAPYITTALARFFLSDAVTGCAPGQSFITDERTSNALNNELEDVKVAVELLRQAYKHEKMREEQDAAVAENIKSIKQLKVRNSLAVEEKAYKELAQKLEKNARLETNLASQENFLITEFIVNLTFVAAFGIMGAFVATQDDVKIGSMLGYVYLIPTFYTVLHNLLKVSPLPSIATSAFEEINGVLSIRQENRVVTVKELSEIYSLQFDDVSFEYSSDATFKLEHISFEVRKGESLGILGLTNSGKSTIVDLATKIIRPKSGKVLVNNCDINKVDTYYLRDQIATVAQDAKLYHGTIEHNVIYPMEMDEYRYNDALNKCRLKALVNGLPKHDQTVIEEGTDILSDIERQKIILANAFYKDAKIYLFDDSTSKFDASGEKEMMDEILKLKNKITVIVSNRINSLVKCSKILILNGGKIVEYGETAALISDTKSAFSKMVKEAKTSKRIS